MATALTKMLRRPLSHVFPDRLLSWLAFEAGAWWRSAREGVTTVRKYRGARGLRVNVGCGPRPISGWVNLDMLLGPQIDYWDCRKGLPFSDGSVDAIFTEHFLEHLEYSDEASTFLRECHRCLSEAGILRVIVPDAERYLRLYAEGDWEGLARVRPLEPTEGGYRDLWLNERYATRMELINAVFRQGGEHKYAYDGETLMRSLREAGFAKVERASFGVSVDPAMAPDTPERLTESLYVEASKC